MDQNGWCYCYFGGYCLIANISLLLALRRLCVNWSTVISRLWLIFSKKFVINFLKICNRRCEWKEVWLVFDCTSVTSHTSLCRDHNGRSCISGCRQQTLEQFTAWRHLRCLTSCFLQPSKNISVPALVSHQLDFSFIAVSYTHLTLPTKRIV